MERSRGLANWGVFLVLLGAIPLAVQWGTLDADVTRQLWRLWPLILVGIGVGLVLRLTALDWIGGLLVAATFGVMGGSLLAGGVSGVASVCVGDDRGGQVATRSGTAADDRFELELELTCGEVIVNRLRGGSWNVEARHEEGRPPSIEEGLSSVSVRSGDQGPMIVPFAGQARRALRITLPTEPALSVSLTLNAARGRMTLGGGPIGRLQGTLNAADVRLDLTGSTAPAAQVSLTLNAASATLVLPAQTVNGSITLNASSLRLCVPSGAGLRIDHEGTLNAGDFSTEGLVRSGERWETPGFDDAAARIDLSVSGAVSSTTLDRSGSCS